ncbi:MAG: hypothetical protein KY452_02995 [Actinobacteria bacterium]|nr:hypothetical protein [Actinomycetota bacterium]
MAGGGLSLRHLAASSRRLAPGAFGAAGVAALGVYAGQAAKYRRHARRFLELSEPAVPGTAAFSRWVEGACAAPLREGNRVSVLRNGEEIAPSMIDAIAGARRSVDLSNYILWSGPMARDFVDALAVAARAGVEVNVLLDAWGSAKRNAELAADLERAGVALAWFRPPRWYQLDQFNNRMHRRVLVVDGTVGFTGGFGMADEWMGDAEGVGRWRDTHLRLEGPVVRDLAGAFLDNWVDTTSRVLAPPLPRAGLTARWGPGAAQPELTRARSRRRRASLPRRCARCSGAPVDHHRLLRPPPRRGRGAGGGCSPRRRRPPRDARWPTGRARLSAAASATLCSRSFTP